MADATSSPTRQLAAFGRGLSWEDVPDAARRATRIAILDSTGCMLGGSATELAAQTWQAVEAMGGQPNATVAGREARTSVPLAAFVNATQANALDYDDAFECDGKGMGHPGATVVAAALAVAEQAGAPEAAFASAVTAGYEVANRIIEAIQPTPARHATVWGVAVHQAFGSGVAAARLLRLSETQFQDAFGLSGTLSTVPAARKWNWVERPLSTPKDVVAAPAETGVKAALLAAAGWHGSRDILDGGTGFWIMAGSDRCDFSRLTDRLGTRWTVQELSFKPYPACRWVHAALEATEGLMLEHGLSAQDISAVEVGTFEDVVVNFADRRPSEMIDAEFSMPWTVAAICIVKGLPKGAQWYARRTLSDPAMHELADKVKLTVDAEAQARHFSDERKSMSVVRIETSDGRHLERRVAVAVGGVVSPWSAGGVEAKFLLQASPIIGEVAAQELLDIVLTLGDGERLGRMFMLMAGMAS